MFDLFRRAVASYSRICQNRGFSSFAFAAQSDRVENQPDENKSRGRFLNLAQATCRYHHRFRDHSEMVLGVPYSNLTKGNMSHNSHFRKSARYLSDV
jgi:hypothetical protein